MPGGMPVADCAAGVRDSALCAGMIGMACVLRGPDGKVTMPCLCDVDGTWTCE